MKSTLFSKSNRLNVLAERTDISSNVVVAIGGGQVEIRLVPPTLRQMMRFSGASSDLESTAGLMHDYLQACARAQNDDDFDPELFSAWFYDNFNPQVDMPIVMHGLELLQESLKVDPHQRVRIEEKSTSNGRSPTALVS